MQKRKVHKSQNEIKRMAKLKYTEQFSDVILGGDNERTE